MTGFSYQLYSSRDYPLDRTIAMLARLGYSAVEGYGGLFDDPEGLRRMLDAAGLSMPSAHMAVGMLEDEPDRALEIIEALGIRTVYAPYLPVPERPGDTAGWHAFGEHLQALSDFYGERGCAFGWHNHDFEFELLADGEVPLAVLLNAAPGISWEADLAWVVRGGADPVRWINACRDRITAVHVKDIAPVGEAADEDGWADVGHGTMAWPDLVRALSGAPLPRLVMEHDKPNDHERFARRSIEAARGLLG